MDPNKALCFPVPWHFCPSSACRFPSQLAGLPIVTGKTVVISNVNKSPAIFIPHPHYLPLKNNAFNFKHFVSTREGSLLHGQMNKYAPQTRKNWNKPEKPISYCWLERTRRETPELSPNSVTPHQQFYWWNLPRTSLILADRQASQRIQMTVLRISGFCAER